MTSNAPDAVMSDQSAPSATHFHTAHPLSKALHSRTSSFGGSHAALAVYPAIKEGITSVNKS